MVLKTSRDSIVGSTVPLQGKVRFETVSDSKNTKVVRFLQVADHEDRHEAKNLALQVRTGKSGMYTHEWT